MKTLSIDIETYSEADLNRTGVYRYAEDPSFEILLFGYSADGGEVQVVDLARGEIIPAEVLDALTDDAVTKAAFNANFERVCLSRYLSDLGVPLVPFSDRLPESIALSAAEAPLFAVESAADFAAPPQAVAMISIMSARIRLSILFFRIK